MEIRQRNTDVLPLCYAASRSLLVKVSLIMHMSYAYVIQLKRLIKLSASSKRHQMAWRQHYYAPATEVYMGH